MCVKDIELDALLALAETAAREAGKLVRNAPIGGLQTSMKSSPTDIVTEMDHASEKLILDVILNARPEDGLMGEEGSSRISESGINWLIDPIDGTVNYSRRLPNYSVSIAAMKDGEALIGVVYDPTMDEIFTATRGGGAKLNEKRISCASTPFAQAIVGTGFSYSSSRRALQAQALGSLLPAVGDIRRPGSAAISFCWVACGRLDAFYEAGLQPWDFAAGALIAAESGAVVKNHNPGTIEGELIIASSPTIMDDLSKVLIGVPG